MPVKPPAPVSNPREGFCAPGCRRSFYLRRCLVCEGPLKRTREDQKVCRKARCRSAWRARRYIAPQAGKLAPETPDFIGPKGLPSTTIPDGAGGSWAGGEYRRIEAKNRAALTAAVGWGTVVEAAVLIRDNDAEPEWREVVSPDGVRCYVTRFRPQERPAFAAQRAAAPDDLSIPPFLRRPRLLA